MMDALKAWLLGVIFTSFAAGLANEMVPKGRGRALVRLVGGVLVALAFLRPLGAIRNKEISLPVANFTQQVEQQSGVYRSEQEKALSAIIAEKTESYIWDKATELGLECTICVHVASGENSIPLPETVELSVAFDPVLAVWIEEVVGIPAEKQIWLEGRIWEKETEDG